MQIKEIFSSIQGEGIYVGYRHLFIRLAGCNLQCEYCDEDGGEGKYLEKTEILDQVMEWSKVYHHACSITGGEPLLQVNELVKLLPDIPLPIYLETNATLPGHLEEIKPYVDIFALDLKPGYENEFQASLELVKAEDVFVKFVLLPKVSALDLRKYSDLVASVSKDIPFVIQPVTPHRKSNYAPSPEEIITAYTLIKKKLNDVRVIPQTHKLIHLC